MPTGIRKAKRRARALRKSDAGAHSKTLARLRVPHATFRGVLECGAPAPLSRTFAKPLALLIYLIALLLNCANSLADDQPQPPEGFPKTWGVTNGQPVAAYYAFATNVAVSASLRALPSLSLRMDMADLFDADRGIYANPLKTGSEWERPVGMDMKYPDGKAGFQINAGIRIQGGWNRRPEESPKHAFRVEFRKKYGAGKLRFPLFGATEPRAFDDLILRAGGNNSWLHWSGEERRHADYIRDQWMRDSYRAMGHPSARGEFVHLYLNGFYWGIYNLAERPGPSFAAAHLGGKADDYDARNSDNILSGDTNVWSQLFSIANAGLQSPQAYAQAGELLDIPAFADFILLNMYGGNGDWDRASNWYAARRRVEGGKYIFFVWDGERTLEDAAANRLADDDDQSPTRLFQKLRENENFRALFAERVKTHLTGNGILSSENAASRFKKLADTLRPAIAAEAARWGAYRHDVHPYKTGPYEVYTREAHWEVEIERVLKEFFPRRNAILLDQFAKAGLR